MGAQALFSKFLTKENQDYSRYIQGGRGRGQDRGWWGKDRFRREDRGSLNRLIGRLIEANRSTGSSDISYSRPRFDKIKINSYNCQNMSLCQGLLESNQKGWKECQSSSRRGAKDHFIFSPWWTNGNKRKHVVYWQWSQQWHVWRQRQVHGSWWIN